MSKIFCAFHPDQTIFNFCKSPTCYLPMCPLCIKIHTAQHKQEKTYGDYESLNGVVGEIQFNIKSLEKVLASTSEDFSSNYEKKKKCQNEIKKKIAEAKLKYTQQFERYFSELEDTILRSLQTYTQSTLEDFTKIDEQMVILHQELQENLTNLFNEKTLKTIITYYSSDSLCKWKEELETLQAKISKLEKRTVMIETDNRVLNDMMMKIEDLVKLRFINYTEHNGKDSVLVKSNLTNRTELQARS